MLPFETNSVTTSHSDARDRIIVAFLVGRQRDDISRVSVVSKIWGISDKLVSVIMVQVLLIWLIRIYIYMLIGRIIVEMIQSFSRQPQYPRWFAVLAEFLFMVTDPPVRALRRVIPPLKLGNVALDVSVLVLFFALQVLIIVIARL